MTLIMQFLDYLFSHEDLEDLEDFNLPKDALQLAKMARFGRDRDGRNVLSILLDWKNVKAFVKGTTLVQKKSPEFLPIFFVDFSEKSFQPIVQSLTLLIAAGADPMVADRLGKCCGHYLAEWRYIGLPQDSSLKWKSDFRFIFLDKNSCSYVVLCA